MAERGRRLVIRSGETEPDSWCGFLDPGLLHKRKSPRAVTRGAMAVGQRRREGAVAVRCQTRSKSLWASVIPFSMVAKTTAFAPPLPSSS